MAIRPIVLVEKDLEFLHKKSKPVEEFDDRLFALLDDMKDTLSVAEGVGLAAPQVGILKRVVLCQLGEKIVEMVNPEIVNAKGEAVDKEGCLSVTGKYANVKRPEKITVVYYDRNKNLCKAALKDYEARIVCHEVDHLNGVLITDIGELMQKD